MEPLNVDDFEALARERLDEIAWEYFRGGAGDETTLRENVAAFARWKLRPRVLVDVSAVDAGTTVLGPPVSMPILIAPTALQKFADPEGEAATARAAARAETIMVLSSSATMRPARCRRRRAGGDALVPGLRLPRSRDHAGLIDEACAGGYSALVLTVDVPILGRREGALSGRGSTSRTSSRSPATSSKASTRA